MNNNLRVVVWNCRRAAAKSKAVWNYLLQLEPSLALLQEVSGIPQEVSDKYLSVAEKAINCDYIQRRFSTAILAEGDLTNDCSLTAEELWVNSELELFKGNLLYRRLQIPNYKTINIVSVHSPANPVDKAKLSNIDVNSVKLKHNPKIWVTDLLWASLRHLVNKSEEPWIVAGDFNSSETFDWGRNGNRGNKEYLDRMSDLGLVECLRFSQGKLTPTFRYRNGEVKHQIDHLFVTKELADRLLKCETGSEQEIFEARLSDHLPIIAEFDLSK